MAMKVEGRGSDDEPAALILRTRQGDPCAQEILLRWLSERLYPTALALAAGEPTADELVGDTVSRIFERLDQLREPAAVEAWARKILVRRFVDGRRRFQRRLRFEAISVEQPAPLEGDAAFVRDAVRRLSRDEQAILVLHYWMGFTLVEVARQLDLPAGTVKSRLHGALQRLRHDLGRDQ